MRGGDQSIISAALILLFAYLPPNKSQKTDETKQNNSYGFKVRRLTIIFTEAEREREREIIPKIWEMRVR